MAHDPSRANVTHGLPPGPSINFSHQAYEKRFLSLRLSDCLAPRCAPARANRDHSSPARREKAWKCSIAHHSSPPTCRPQRPPSGQSLRFSTAAPPTRWSAIDHTRAGPCLRAVPPAIHDRHRAPGRRVALELELKKMEAVRPEPRSDIDTVCHVTVASSCPRGRAVALHIHAVVACCHAFMAQTARQQPRKS